MKSRNVLLLVVTLAVHCAHNESLAENMGTAFTYQGELRQNDTPVGELCDFDFTMWDASTLGNQVGPTLTFDGQGGNPAPIMPENGLFTVLLDFGPDAIIGEARWLEIKVCCPSPCGNGYTTLSPRQELTPAPHALALPGLWTQQNDTSPNLIGGFSGNVVGPFVVGATIGGGGDASYPNSAAGDYVTVGGGLGNEAGDEGGLAYGNTVGGGGNNTATGAYSTVGGGVGNLATGMHCTVGGGEWNEAASYSSTVGGGGWNEAIGDGATVGGGGWNTALGSSATVSGGLSNEAFGNTATICGGSGNLAGDPDPLVFAVSATVGGGYGNRANARYATVGGGDDNAASGSHATVPGGLSNDATGSYSFAGGRRAKANHDGSFVWADSTDADCTSSGPDQFVICASGGVGIGRTPAANALELEGDASKTVAGDWLANSDARIKTDVTPVKNALKTIDRLRPVRFKYTQEYRAEHPSIADAHYFNYIAQEYQTVFPEHVKNSGDDGLLQIDAYPASVYAVAGVQELHELAKEKDARIAALEARLAALEAMVTVQSWGGRSPALGKGGAPTAALEAVVTAQAQTAEGGAR